MRWTIILAAFCLWIGCQTTPEGQPNHLINESSPYLLQHAYNPVDWYPWNDAALAKAKAEDKLIIISVGYSSCHWCHVMEHESFEDATVARIMNDHFVNIKVDREERPDIDNVYMAACQLASQGGCGWPLNAFALPDGRPVWAGTYFPKDNWKEIMTYFKDLYVEDRGKLEQYAKDLVEGISTAGVVEINTADQEFTADQLTTYTDRIIDQMDMQKGGRIGAPKFPMPGQFDYLMKYGTLMDNDQALQSVDVSLREIAQGGIFDHIDGGWARYSVDGDWHVPHFEKMLYDNGQLISLYSKGYQRTKAPLYKTRIEETLDFIDRQWTDTGGGIYSSYDADSENEFGHKEEGAFYVWTREEIIKVLGASEMTDAFMAYYDIREKGNWEDKNIFRVVAPKDEILQEYNLEAAAFDAYIEAAISKIRKARAARKAPGLDDKILTSWNALMLQGYVDAYQALGAETYKNKALAIGTFIQTHMMQSDGRLLRNHKDRKSVINAFLEDYALVARAFVGLYQITFDEAWLDRADLLLKYTDDHFYDEVIQMYDYTSKDDPPLVAKTADFSDNVIPGANSVMAEMLYKVGTYLNNAAYKNRAKQMLHNVLPSIDKIDNPAFYYNWLSLYMDIIRPPYEVAILGADYADKVQALQAHYTPNALFLGGTSEGQLELLKNKLVDGQTMIYVCQNKVCKLPTEDVDKALSLMEYGGF